MNKETFCQTVDQFVRQVGNRYPSRHYKGIEMPLGGWEQIELISERSVPLNELQPNKVYIRYYGDEGDNPALHFMGIIDNPAYGVASPSDLVAQGPPPPLLVGDIPKFTYWSLMGYLGDERGITQVSPALSRGIKFYMEYSVKIQTPPFFWSDSEGRWKWNGWSGRGLYCYELNSLSYFLNWLNINPLEVKQ